MLFVVQNDFDIIYHYAPHALSRTFCAHIYDNAQREMHKSLRHPGVKHLHYFVCVKNLPNSVNKVYNVVAKCKVCP